MSTISLDITVRKRRVLSWAAIIGGAAIALVIGLPSAQSFLSHARRAEANLAARRPVAAQPVAADPVTFAIVPAPVIETNPQFFFGSGDGSSGYYSQRAIEQRPDASSR